MRPLTQYPAYGKDRALEYILQLQKQTFMKASICSSFQSLHKHLLKIHCITGTAGHSDGKLSIISVVQEQTSIQRQTYREILTFITTMTEMKWALGTTGPLENRHLTPPERVSVVGCFLIWVKGFPGGSVVKSLPASARDAGSIPGSGRSPGEGNGTSLQYSCLGNPMDRGAWRATVHGVAKSQTRLSN